MRGISLHEEVLKMINQGLKYGEVHSVFNRTLNLVDENGCMISLMAKNMDEVPFSIIVEVDSFRRCGTFAGEKVYFDKEKVTIGLNVIDISGAKSYRLKRGIFRMNDPVLEKNLDILRHLLDSKGPKEKYSFDITAFQMVLHKMKLLKRACLEEAWEEVITIGRGLMGLGQGLTPSGDDVLMGLFLVLGLENSPMGPLDAILEKIIKGGVEDTTDISYQGLLRASKGFYRSLLVAAAEALAVGEDIEDILIEVLSIGHSSGRDLLCGILTGYEILLEKENENVN